MKIIVFGCGNYVLGSGEYHGTILPSVLEFASIENIEEIIFIKDSSKNIKNISDRINYLISKKKLKIPFKILTQNNDRISDLIKEVTNVFCAIISTPDHTHYKLIKLCLKNKINLITVKPFTISSNESLKLINLQKNNNLFCAVDFHKRFDKHNLLIKKNVYDNKFKVIHLNINYSQIKSIPLKEFKKWSNKTNIFQYLAVHYVDLIFFIFNGIVPLRAMALGNNQYLKQKGINTYDYVTSIIEWKLPNGRVFSSFFNVNWVDPLKSSAISEQNLTIHMDDKKIFSDQKNRGFDIYFDNKSYESINPDFSKEYRFNKRVYWSGYGIESFLSYFNTLKLLKKNFLKDHQIDERICTFKDAAKSVKITEMVNKSLKNKNVWIDA